MRLTRFRAGAGLLVGLVAALALSGEDAAGPRTPPALAGLPEPFLGVAPISNGGLLAAVDAYGSLVEARWPGTAGPALIDNPRERQEAGTVDPDTGIVVRAAANGRDPLSPWEGSGFTQHYVSRSNVLVTHYRVAGARVRIRDWVEPAAPVLVRRVSAEGVAGPARIRLSIGRAPGLRCSGPRQAGGRLELRCSPRASSRRTGDWRRAAAADRRWLAQSRSLGGRAPAWAHAAYERSLLVLHGMVDRRTGAVPASPRDHWHYVWPRDAALVAIALRRAGQRGDACRVARFLRRLPLESAARFDSRGGPVAGRPAPGDAPGWARAAISLGCPRSTPHAVVDAGQPGRSRGWRARDDYWETGRGDWLGNAIVGGASAEEIRRRFGTARGLRRGREGGLDSAAAWAIVPFNRRGMRQAARSTLVALSRDSGRFGIRPGTGWTGPEPWTAPTAWSAWALAELGENAYADRLLRALRRAATPSGTLPERVDHRTGVARSATPLAWSHAAFALALLARYPPED